MCVSMRGSRQNIKPATPTVETIPAAANCARAFHLRSSDNQISAAANAARPDADTALRADSLGLLALGNAASYEQLFKNLLDLKQPEAVQAAAARALGP